MRIGIPLFLSVVAVCTCSLFSNAHAGPAQGSGAPPSGASTKAKAQSQTLSQRRYLPFNNTDAYRQLKVATEAGRAPPPTPKSARPPTPPSSAPAAAR
jgi:hypothetical protein